MKPPSRETSQDLGAADVHLLVNPTRARLWNQTNERVEIPPRSGLPKEEGDALKPLVLSPGGHLELSFEDLARYEVESAIDARRVRRVSVDPFVTVTNKTARRIWIEPGEGGGGEGRGLIIPAFGTRRIGAAALRVLDYKPWVDHNLIGVEPESTAAPDRSDSSFAGVAIALAWVLVVALVPSLFGWSPSVGQRWLVGIAGFTLISGLSSGLTASGWRPQSLGTPLAQSVNLGLLLAVALGVPLGAALAGATGGAAGATTLAELSASLPQLYRLTLMTLLGLLPGLLYFQYERQRVAELREKFLRDIMLLNPNVRTLDDARITYGASVDEVSGAVGADSRQFWLLGRGRPILVSTLLIALGWVYVFQRDGARPASLGEAMSIARDVFSFAFLGAYFFAVQLLFRRFARGDLTPKVYGHVAVRIASAMLAAWLLSAMPENRFEGLLLVVAFLCGIVPETAVALGRDAARQWLSFLPSLEETHPITDLEGVNLYDRVRLLEEGVENVENLAHHDIIELMLRSRIPTPRLVDLVDQAILYLHVRAEDGESRAPLRKLRSLGIRTASDLVLACETLDQGGAARTEAAAGANPPGPSKRDMLLGVLGPEDAGSPRALEVILRALHDDEWFDFVSHWRQQSRTAGQAYTLATLTGAQRAGAPAPADAGLGSEYAEADMERAV